MIKPYFCYFFKKMTLKDIQITIIGGGVSGLIAAKTLEEFGFSPTILEGSDRLGGRVKTDVVDGYQLDHGFQVLLSNYPAAVRYLDYDRLELQEFRSGAAVYKNGNLSYIGDPMRDSSVLFTTLFSRVGTLKDKWRILSLQNELKKKSIPKIFNTKEHTTMQYLKDYGFSPKIVKHFFKPFLSGIFLEEELVTSSRMFEFVYKMFAEGFAALPKKGMEAIPQQLAAQLSKTKIKLNTRVKAVTDTTITLDDGSEITSEYTIIATEAGNLISNLKNQSVDWKSCDTLYFTTPKRNTEKPFIGLIANADALINTIFYHSSVDMEHCGKDELLSVTVVKEHQLSEEELVAQVKTELQRECGIKNLRFLKRYQIPKALPQLRNLQYDATPSETQLNERIFLAGDVQLNGSLNAAMLSGEKAALGLVQVLGKTGVIQ